MGDDPAERLSDLGQFIREQRNTARLSLRRLSELAGISNPYLSQIERGLRRPSAEILQQIARALRISAETLYVQAGILDPPVGVPDLARQILGDPYLSEEQKQALVRIYVSFRRDHELAAGAGTGATRWRATRPASHRRTNPCRRPRRRACRAHRPGRPVPQHRTCPDPPAAPPGRPGSPDQPRPGGPRRRPRPRTGGRWGPAGRLSPACDASPSSHCTRHRWPSRAPGTVAG